MIRGSFPLVLACLSIVSVLPRATSYAKVSRNGQEGADAGLGDQSATIISNGTQSESRSFKKIAITVSPVYVPPKVSSLKNGEAIDYSPVRYSTLDHEMIAKLNAKKQIQDRYHPPTLYNFKDKEPASDAKESPKPAAGRPTDPPTGPTSPGGFDFSKPTFSASYDYEPPDYLASKPISKPADYLGDKPISKPLSMGDYGDSDMNDKPSDSYKPDSYYGSHDYSDYPPDGSYGNDDAGPKPMEYSGHLDRPPYGGQDDENGGNDDDGNGDDGNGDDHSYGHHGHHHDFHHEVIYDHIPEYHEHVEEPEMNDQRLNKKPYSYYFIGRKLWYIPLYFSIYFIIYIAALVLKSIARHKITFPEHLADAVNHHRSYNEQTWWDYTGSILQSVETFAEKYGKVS